MRLPKRVVRKIEASARRGARLLDKRRPGWFKRGQVAITRLNIESPCDCVLGQMEGRYTRGLAILYRDVFGEGVFEKEGGARKADEFGERHGFNLLPQKHIPFPVGEGVEKFKEWEEKGNEMFRVLTGEWVKLIRERRARA